MHQKVIYIGGKVTGLPYAQVERKFRLKELDLINTSNHVIVNPVREIDNLNQERQAKGQEPWTDTTHRKEIMGYCLHLLSTCDSLYLLPDWHHSKGAQMERDFASKMGMEVVYM